MEDTEVNEPRTKRQKTNHKSAVFERLKQLKGKGSKNKYEVSNLENVYEVIDEKEYSKKVWERQEDDWIVDDDGSGYVEDGRDIFDDDLDSQSIAQASKSTDTRKRKKNISKSAGKGNIQAMLSNMPEKKKETVSLDQDDILSDVLSGMDENASKSNKDSHDISMDNEEQEVKDYMKSFSVPKPVKIKPGLIKIEKSKHDLRKVLNEKNIIQNNTETVHIKNDNDDNICKNNDESINDKTDKKEIIKTETHTEKLDGAFEDDFNVDVINDTFGADEMNDDFDIDVIDEDIIKAEKESPKSDNIAKNDITEETFINNWENMQEGVQNDIDVNISIDATNLPLCKNADNEQVFRFFWWDAYEDVLKQPGTVYLFGKTYVESAQSYASCCVVVKNVERKIFILPRPFILDASGNETDIPVKIIDVFKEWQAIADSRKILTCRSRPINKKYAFDPDIPNQSDYLEVRYGANFIAMDKNTTGKTFSRIFGTDTSFLEILLLDRKIKGPSWLEIKNPIPVTNPISWCKFELHCNSSKDISVINDEKKSPPPLVVATINIQTVPLKQDNEIVMIGCLVNNKYYIDKQPPNPPFQSHFCVFTKPSQAILPLDIHNALKNYKATQVKKLDSEKALLNYFLSRFIQIDPDLVVGHDLLDFHLSTLCARLAVTNATQWSRIGRLKRSIIPVKAKSHKDFLLGRLVCDLKVSARELIKSRSYDLDTLCQTVLKLKDNERPALESGDVVKFFNNSDAIMKLINFTMQDAGYITKMMYELNVMPLALQITNIAGNVMSKTLQGGRAQRNEFLLLHAFTERNYVCPDKSYNSKENVKKTDDTDNQQSSKSSRKKPTYSGGLVLDPKVGFYDKLILLMDFNSLYPSIIQEYNICFTTMLPNLDTETMLANVKSESGILPAEIRKLVESRRQVKKLMANPDISNDLRMQYNIRQLALKLTANSMYGCLGFQNSRFFAKHLASLITLKGRDILLHTRDLVQGMGFEVVYGDTDSIMINTNILDYDQVFKIGNNIKQAVNKSYRQVELDVDGVFKYMLLLKKKKYAAVTMSKNKSGEIVLHQEHKGLDIVRRDWSMLASEVGKMVLNHILSDQSADERIENINGVLQKVANDLREGKIPLPFLVITKQLTKDPTLYTDKTALSHVLVALRYNQKGGKPLGAGDTVPYVICEDGTNASNTQRAYHVEELKHSDKLKIDVHYYLALQIHPVVSRLCEPIEGLNAYYIANSLGIDASSFKVTQSKSAEHDFMNNAPTKVFTKADPFQFVCLGCKEINTVKNLIIGKDSNARLWLEKCSNTQCQVKPIEYLYSLQNNFVLNIKNYIEKYYDKILICEDPLCTIETSDVPIHFFGKYPICTLCAAGVMYRKFSERDLYEQIGFYKYLCDITKIEKKNLKPDIVDAYKKLKDSIEYFLKESGYYVINLTTLCEELDLNPEKVEEPEILYESDDDLEYDD